MKRLWINKCWKGCGKRADIIHCWWNCKLLQEYWREIAKEFQLIVNTNIPYLPETWYDVTKNRLVYNLPFLGKMMEFVMVDQLHSFLGNICAIDPFISSLVLELTELIELVDDLCLKLNRYWLLALLFFSAVFYILYYYILTHQLTYRLNREVAFQWFE